MELSELSSHGRLMPLHEFLRSVELAYLTDYDGSGYLAMETCESNIQVIPSEINSMLSDHPEYLEWATHVMWFNKES